MRSIFSPRQYYAFSSILLALLYSFIAFTPAHSTSPEISGTKLVNDNAPRVATDYLQSIDHALMPIFVNRVDAMNSGTCASFRRNAPLNIETALVVGDSLFSSESRFQDALLNKLSASGIELSPLNYQYVVSGQGIQDMLAILQAGTLDSDLASADIFLLNLGVNNWSNAENNLSQVQSWIDQVIAYVSGIDPDIVIVWVEPHAVESLVSIPRIYSGTQLVAAYLNQKDANGDICLLDWSAYADANPDVYATATADIDGVHMFGNEGEYVNFIIDNIEPLLSESTETNTTGKITIIKDALPNNPQDFTFSATGGNIAPSTFSLDDDPNNSALANRRVYDLLDPAVYRFTETNIPSGWTLSSVTCTNAGATTAITNGVEINLAAGDEITCTFTNTNTNPPSGATSSIKLCAHSHPHGGHAQDFTFSASGALTTQFTLDDDPDDATLPDCLVFDGLTPGETYIFTETDTPAGWIFEGAGCLDGVNSTFVRDYANQLLRVTPAANENLHCIFNNAQQGTITIEKQTLPDGDTTSFTFSGGLSATLADNQTVTVTVAPGAYTIVESAVADWVLTNIACDDTDSNGNSSTGTAVINVALGENVRCVFTSSATNSSSEMLVGDTNCDEVVDSVDALFILRHVVNSASDRGSCPLTDDATEINAAAGDIDGDGDADVIDALSLLRCIVNLPNPYCDAFN